jgi:predicted O-linked N-acetylglucosamine transferase (SPINDLY family)
MNVSRIDEAEDAYRRAVQIRPDLADAHFSLGYLLDRLGKLSEAEQSLRQALRLAPDDPLAHNQLGKVLVRLDRPQQAMVSLREALRLNPNSAHAHSNLASALRMLEQFDAAEQSSRRALALKPDLSAAHTNLGEALAALGRPEEALQSHREAIRLEPASPVGYAGLATALMHAGRLAEAEQSYRQALQLEDPKLAHSDLMIGHSNLIFTLDLMETTDARAQQEERRRWYSRYAERYAAQAKPHQNIADPERKLRVGYVSADLRTHSASFAFAPVIVGHDPAAFEVVCYSGVKREDAVTERLRGAAQGWRSTLGVSDDDLAEQIRGDGIDILVDLSGHSEGNRLLVFARKPAPVQVTAWGHATGTGLMTMDYLLADPVLVPREERELYAEEVVDLPCVLCYEPPQYMPEVSPLPSSTGEPFTFGCVNRLEKVTDRVIALWGRILASAPDARLLIKDKVLDDAELRKRLLSRLHAVAGIASARVVTLGQSPHAAHLTTFHRIDVGLDPFPQGGGISSLEALYMGVPIVTLCGATTPSRLTTSILYLAQMQDWVAKSDDDYVRIALQKKNDLQALVTLRQQLRARFKQSPFGDLKNYVRAVEQVYRASWRRWCGRS